MTDRRRRAAGPAYLRRDAAWSSRLPPLVWTAGVAALMFAAIEGLARSGAVGASDLVPVSSMASRAGELLSDPKFLRDELLRTVSLIALSFVLASATGLVIAYVMWRSSWIRSAVRPYLDIYYSLPLFAVYPMLVVLLGTGIAPIVLLASSFSLVVVVTNAYAGLNGVPPVIDKLAASLSMPRGRYVRSVLLPAAAPDIATGLKLALGFSIIAVLASEFILSTQGLGHFISAAYTSFKTEDMYAGVLMVVVLSLVGNVAIAVVAARFDWRRR